MSQFIQKVCVIGAGQMGAQIAAQMANGGLSVLLLDVEKACAHQAVTLLKKAKPAGFMDPKFANNIETGSSIEDMAKIADCDWILEAVLEDKALKHKIYNSFETHRKTGSIISSNTSTLRRSDLIDGMSTDFKKDFFITHFFNPPRYMRLLELIGGPKCDLDKQKALKDCCDQVMGKTVIECNDTPGFLANRLGIFWLYTALQKTFEHGKTVEEADRLLSKPFGIPKTGIFGLMDLVGIDLMPFVTQSMVKSLNANDPFVQNFKPIDLIEDMIKEGYTGRKGKGGFYRLNKKVKEVRDLKTGDYSPCGKKKKEKRPADQLLQEDPFVAEVMGATLLYACQMVGDATDHLQDIDQAMKLGYNWKMGPFELMDQIGADRFIQGLGLPYEHLPDILQKVSGNRFYQNAEILNLNGHWQKQPTLPGVLTLQELKQTQKPLLKNPSASLWNIGHGVVCFEFTSQMNMIDHMTMELMEKSIALCAENYSAMVLYNEGTNFSIGANLGLALFQANIAAFDEIQKLVIGGQQVMQALKYAPFPVIGAPHGMALGGGCEFLLHCDHVVAHAESYIGLVETGVGLIPAWGGLKEMLGRWQANPKFANGPIPAAQKTFETVGLASVSTSAFEAKKLGFFKHNCDIIMNRDRLLFEARDKAVQIAENYTPPKTNSYRLSGLAGKCAFDMAVQSFIDQGKATPHDQTVMSHLSHVLSGGPSGDMMNEQTEDDILKLEQSHFMELVQHPLSLDRIEHMVLNHKPLRN